MLLTSDGLLLVEGRHRSPPLIEPVATTALETTSASPLLLMLMMLLMMQLLLQGERVRDVLIGTPGLIQHGEVDASEEGMLQHFASG